MNIIHILNIADVALMAAGVAVALLMMVVSAGDEAPGAEQPRKDGRS